VTTFGAPVVAAIPYGHGEPGSLAWLAAQTGGWYGTDHGGL
jgi:hypothetical protein